MFSSFSIDASDAFASGLCQTRSMYVADDRSGDYEITDRCQVHEFPGRIFPPADAIVGSDWRRKATFTPRTLTSHVTYG